jgi:hypothetical protein
LGAVRFGLADELKMSLILSLLIYLEEDRAMATAEPTAQAAVEPAAAPHAASAAEEVSSLRRRLDARVNRADVRARLNALFASGTVPDPAPDGFLQGELVMTSTFRALDAYGRWISGLWMPWLGKAFEASASTGINRLSPSARLPTRLLWPSHPVRATEPGILEAFPFRTRIERGAVDAGTNVLVIDYDFEANPAFVIRRIRDELVQVGDGFYLGKVLMRLRGEVWPIGFFSLRRR